MIVTIEWHLILLAIAIAALWIWQSYNDQDTINFRAVAALLGTIFLIILYGGIYWW